MANPQKEHGYIGIANEIWDEVIRRDFTKRQKDILLFVLRLSYGCNQKSAIIPLQQDFVLGGLGGKGHVKEELTYLVQCKVLEINEKEYLIKKNYDLWQVSPVRGWNATRFKELLHLNLKESKKRSKEVPKTGTLQDEEKLLKQELEVTETGTKNENELPKQEPRVTETGTATPLEPNQDKSSEALKKGLKKEDIKKEKIIKNISTEIDNFLSRYSQEQRLELDKYLLFIGDTRKSKKLADNIVLKIYQYFDKFTPIRVEYAIKTHMGSIQHSKAKEEYTFGIARNTSAEEAARKLQSSNNGRNQPKNDDELRRRLEEKDRAANRNA